MRLFNYNINFDQGCFFIVRDGNTLICPHSDARCGSWCPKFDVVEVAGCCSIKICEGREYTIRKEDLDAARNLN